MSSDRDHPTDIGSVNEAEQIEKRHGRHKVQVQLSAQPGLGLGVELDEGVAEPGARGQFAASRADDGDGGGWVVSLVRGGMASLSGVVMVADGGGLGVVSSGLGGTLR